MTFEVCSTWNLLICVLKRDMNGIQKFKSESGLSNIGMDSLQLKLTNQIIGT